MSRHEQAITNTLHTHWNETVNQAHLDEAARARSRSWRDLAHDAEDDAYRLRQERKRLMANNQALTQDNRALRQTNQVLEQANQTLTRKLEERSGQYDVAIGVFRDIFNQAYAAQKTIMHMSQAWRSGAAAPDKDIDHAALDALSREAEADPAAKANADHIITGIAKIPLPKGSRRQPKP